MKIIKLNYDDGINFIWKTQRYGRAEFKICPVWKYGKLKKVYIIPVQQPDKRGICYEIDAHNQREFQISAWTHKGLKDPKIWLMYYCKEHKTICYRIYVPVGSKSFSIYGGSGFKIIFDNENVKEIDALDATDQEVKK